MHPPAIASRVEGTDTHTIITIFINTIIPWENRAAGGAGTAGLPSGGDTQPPNPLLPPSRSPQPRPRCGSSPPVPWAGPPQRGPVSPRRARSPRLPRGRCLSRLPGEAAPAPGAARTHRPSPWPWRRPGLPHWLPDGGGARRAGGGGPGRRRQRGGGALTRTAPPRRGEGGREGGAGRGGGIPRGCGNEQRGRPPGQHRPHGGCGRRAGEAAHPGSQPHQPGLCTARAGLRGISAEKPTWECRQLHLTCHNFVPCLFTGPQDRIGLLVACVKWNGQLHPHLDGH